MACVELSLASDPASAALDARFAALTREAIGRAQPRGIDTPAGAGAAFAHLTRATARVPLPGSGQTAVRWAALAAVARVDVTLGRLFEAHMDAAAILNELGGEQPKSDERWAVWAAEGPRSTAEAEPAGDSFTLSGRKPWASGSTLCTHALVTATCRDTPSDKALFAVQLAPDVVEADVTSWQAAGLSGSATYEVAFHGAPATMIGVAGSYLTRPGFWHGGAGVAAVWWGAAAGVAETLYAAVGGSAGPVDPYRLSHLGAIEVALASSRSLLLECAATIDDSPEADDRQQRALTVRCAVEAAAEEVLGRVGRALGPAPMCLDRAHARRVEDLTLYVRQSHAERDLAQLGELVGRRYDLASR